MTDRYDISRRKVLAGLGTIGVAGAGAGMGTSAYFSDEETFEDNELVAGELDLVVDYDTKVDQGAATGETGSTTGSGTIQGNPATGEYQIADVKPGDSGGLYFCPKIVDNPAWLYVGSNGVVDSENGFSEPEEEVDDTSRGELSEVIQVTVEYCKHDGDGGYTTLRELNNPDDYTLADLGRDLQAGFLIDGDVEGEAGTQAYPSSPDDDTQTGPCICVYWEVPEDVGNEIQTDGVEFDAIFAAIQERHNPEPANPFVDETFVSNEVYVHRTSDLGFSNEQVAVSDINAATGSGVPDIRPPTVEVSYGPQTVVYRVHPTIGMEDPSNMAIAFDPEADGGAWDTQVLWQSGGAGFTYMENGGVTDDPANVAGVSAAYDSASNAFIVGIDRSTLEASSDDYRFAMQSIHEPSAPNNPLNPSGSNARLDAELPSGFGWGDTSTWQDDTLQ